MPTTFPGGGPTITVEAILKQPRLLTRALGDLVNKRFVADRVFARGSSDQVAGGAALYQKSESIYMNRDAEEVGIGAEYPRAAWTEAVYTAAVKKYGLEFPVYDETRRRNALDVFQRGFKKLGNSLVKFVDTVAVTLLGDTTQGIQTMSASGDWTTAATDIIADIANARAKVANVDEGYEADTLLIHPNQELDFLIDSDIRNALPREGGNPQSPVVTGRVVPILGLRQVLVSNQMTSGTAFVLESGTVGTIADEQPAGDEGYTAYNPGAGQAPVYTKQYRIENTDATILRGARFPAMWMAEPQAVVKITGA